ncbi:6-phosphogluconolactonase [Devosia sp. 63-57]|uniref:6-phosphogluconolactonase n=1 Tax=Devosia sp. 63-57 TaxID=1895751 RepID=UPI00086CDEDD|nr:6-phosphogluconolactonase [Devosia sp. 63-57]ODT47581.1 MAG: 6-phosphogluconolactonase [Pelagibacterium sp. SCN 63-126]ODU86391.1 MAG: 6-phosphogluconolactonase [Pelagibacterium sp. SCN 63-17]OJX42712.1 MAG: 6-phosphogluconolactonase [Devosia sp. 63-57]
MTLDRRSFADKPTLAKELAESVADRIRSAIATRGEASIAVSGGSTPGKFFQALGKTRDIDWSKVTVTLVDERWVPETSDRSNALLVNEKMLQGPAAIARFFPLYSGGEVPDAAAVAKTNALMAELPKPFAAVILGMGNDGHTASFFPGGDTLDQALTAEGPTLALEAPGAGEPRITFTLPRLLETDALYLHIEGDEKAAVLDKALADGPVAEMPVRAVLRSGAPLTVYWCP